MPILLFIADVALREAVVEQIAAAKLGAPRFVETAPDLLKQVETEEGNSGVIVIDAPCCDKAMLVALIERTAPPTVLVLGEAEADEGVTESFAKPFRLGHLMARLRYYLETAPLLRERSVTFGPYRLEPQNRSITMQNGEVIRLTEKETSLLTFLAHSTQPQTRRDILAAVWGYDERIDTHTLETHIYQLRRKFDKDGAGDSWLVFEDGGYRLAKGGE